MGRLKDAARNLLASYEKIRNRKDIPPVLLCSFRWRLTVLYEKLNKPDVTKMWHVKHIAACDVWIKSLKPGNSTLIHAYRKRAGSYLYLGKLADAERDLRKAIAIARVYEVNTWFIFDTNNMLGSALARQNKFKESESLLTSGYKGLVESLAQVTPPNRRNFVRECLQRIIRFYDGRKMSAKSSTWQKELDNWEKKWQEESAGK